MNMLVTIGSYATSMGVFIAVGIFDMFSTKIDNQADLYLHLLEEKAELGIYEPIVLRDKSGGYMPAFIGARCRRIQGIPHIDYDITNITLSTLRHELYHIKQGDIDSANNDDGFFGKETRCDIYAMTGLRL